ncbi:transposase [Paenibacillus sp. NPDC056579]|uniref:transposase n=1 Tax=Paenibacillus sp. NPDC056579 TaxID=3345871 RepID=UPI0036AD4003
MMSAKRKKYPPELKAQIVMQMMMQEKTTAQLSDEHHIHPNVLNRWKSKAICNFAKLFLDEEKEKNKLNSQQKDNEHRELQVKVEQLTSQLEWIKKNHISNVSRKQRISWLEQEHPEISLSTQAGLLNLIRSSLYYKANPSQKKSYIKKRIMEIRDQFPQVGYRKIAELLREDCVVHENTIYKYLKELDIEKSPSTA